MLWHKTKTKPNSDFYQNRKQFRPKDTLRCWWRQYRVRWLLFNRPLAFAPEEPTCHCVLVTLLIMMVTLLPCLIMMPALRIIIRWWYWGANKLSQETQIPRNFSLHWILVRPTGWEVGEFSETFLYFPTIACYLYLGRSSSVLKYQT